ncbi:MAG: COX15/CtaA family protein [Gammaproteobacteria bacterium]|nr:COX15/CtaA family protein [Gammaproteobacteria bacterium]
MVDKTLLRLAKFALALAAVVVVLGAYTRLSDAGLGCPDWPGCYGFLSVPETAQEVLLAQTRFPDAPVEPAKAWWEMVHRYFATSLGLVVLVIAGVAVAKRARAIPLKLPLALLALVIVQGAFGAWTVTLKLWPQVVTAHLLGGFATVSLLWLLCLRLGSGADWQVARSVRTPALIALVVLIVQIAIGGWVSSNYAALACPDFPMCHGVWVPEMDLAQGLNFAQSVGPNYLGGIMDSEARVAIQVIHRLGALAALMAIGWLGVRLLQTGSILAWPVLGVLALQLLLGIANVVLVLPLLNATLHNAFAAVLLLGMVTVNYRAYRGGPIVE